MLLPQNELEDKTWPTSTEEDAKQATWERRSAPAPTTKSDKGETSFVDGRYVGGGRQLICPDVKANCPLKNKYNSTSMLRVPHNPAFH